MDAVKNDVKRLVKIELAAANRKFRMFASNHEGVAVIQEEAVEAAREMDGLHRELNAMWMGVYSNDPQISTKGVYDRAVTMMQKAGSAITACHRKERRTRTRRTPASFTKRETSAKANSLKIASPS